MKTLPKNKFKICSLIKKKDQFIYSLAKNKKSSLLADNSYPALKRNFHDFLALGDLPSNFKKISLKYGIFVKQRQ